MNGGSTRWAPMVWPVLNFIGDALLRHCCVFFTMSSPWWIGALSSWMTFAGFWGNLWQNLLHVPFFYSWWLLAAPWVGRKRPLAYPILSWGLSWPPIYNWSGMNWSWQYLTRWWKTRPLQGRNWIAPWVDCSGLPTVVHSQSLSYKHFGRGNQQSGRLRDPITSSRVLRASSTASLRRFHYQVKEEKQCWAFKDRKPKRRIAALEKFGTLLLTMYLCKKSSSLRGPVLLPLFQLTATSCSLIPSHVKRDLNQWADDLTHPSFEGFDTSLEMKVEPLFWQLKIFGYYNISMLKEIFLRWSQLSLPLLLQSWKRGRRVSTGFGGAIAHGPYPGNAPTHLFSLFRPLVPGRETWWVCANC